MIRSHPFVPIVHALCCPFSCCVQKYRLAPVESSQQPMLHQGSDFLPCPGGMQRTVNRDEDRGARGQHSHLPSGGGGA